MRTWWGGIGRLIREVWPSLGAILVAGWVLHAFGLMVAAIVAVRIPALGISIIPLAILLFVAAYVMTFRVLRSHLPAFRSVSGLDVWDGPVRAETSAFRSASDVATAVVLPFFVMYAAWGFVDQDVATYTDHVYRRYIYIDGFAPDRPVDFSISWLLAAVMLGAYAIRVIAERLMGRWPIFGVIGAYFEALWVFLLSVLILSPFWQVFSWIGQSNLWDWIERAWSDLAANFAWIDAFGAVAAPVLQAAGAVLAACVLPLAWFALAAIVMGRPTVQGVWRSRFLSRHPRIASWSRDVAAGFGRAPRPIRAVVEEVGEDVMLRATSLSGAFRALRALGLLQVAAYVAAWALLDFVSGWLIYAMRTAIGPMPELWWIRAFNWLLVVPWIITEVPRVCLVAWVYDASLRRDAELTARYATEPQAGRTVGIPSNP